MTQIYEKIKRCLFRSFRCLFICLIPLIRVVFLLPVISFCLAATVILARRQDLDFSKADFVSYDFTPPPNYPDCRRGTRGNQPTRKGDQPKQHGGRPAQHARHARAARTAVGTRGGLFSFVEQFCSVLLNMCSVLLLLSYSERLSLDSSSLRFVIRTEALTLLFQEKVHSLVVIFEADSLNSIKCRG